jgi:hypothetical protein
MQERQRDVLMQIVARRWALRFLTQTTEVMRAIAGLAAPACGAHADTDKLGAIRRPLKPAHALESLEFASRKSTVHVRTASFQELEVSGSRILETPLCLECLRFRHSASEQLVV